MFHPKITSYFISINILHSLYNSLYTMAILETCVLATSIIYHNNIIPNFRKYDMIVANSIILHHFYLYSEYISNMNNTNNINNTTNYTPALFYSLAIGSYISGRVYNEDRYHGYLHIYGIIANILLNTCLVSNDMKIIRN
jgi:hypothetical protein